MPVKIIFSLLILCNLFITNALSQSVTGPQHSNAPLNFCTQDGLTCVWPYKILVSNGTLTDNGNGTASLSTGGGGGSCITISAFTNNKNNLEKGITVSSTVLNWTTSTAPTTLSLNQGIGSISSGLTTYTDTASYSTSRTYTLTASDGTCSPTANTSVTFLDSNYFGVNSSATLNDTQINALSSSLSSTRVQTHNGLTPAAQYLYIAYPASYGVGTITVNGFLDNSWVLAVQNHTNASGSTSSYNVFRSANLLTGTYNVSIN